MRIRFDEQLELLNRKLIEMGALCEDAISASMHTLKNETDKQSAEKAAALEREIDHKEREIESLCMKLLLQQQPVARDLRTISSALKMISDLERIGDQASDIAGITGYIEDEQLKSGTHIYEMARAASRMVTDSVDSFVRKDLGKARCRPEGGRHRRRPVRHREKRAGRSDHRAPGPERRVPRSFDDRQSISSASATMP